jgi:hypothetical protein
VSVTPLKVDLTDHEDLAHWTQSLAALAGVAKARG